MSIFKIYFGSNVLPQIGATPWCGTFSCPNECKLRGGTAARHMRSRKKSPWCGGASRPNECNSLGLTAGQHPCSTTNDDSMCAPATYHFYAQANANSSSALPVSEWWVKNHIFFTMFLEVGRAPGGGHPLGRTSANNRGVTAARHP